MDRNRTRNATGRRLDLDYLAAPGRAERYSWIYLIGCNPWPGPQPRCPLCQGRPLRKKEYCLFCDRAGLDGVAVYPGERIGSRMDPDYPATATTVPAATDGLKGGKGDRAARQKKRGKKGRTVGV